MSCIVVIDKVIKEKEPYEGEFDGKPYVSYEWIVSGSVDGVFKEKMNIKTGKEALREKVVSGSVFECEFKDNKGFKSYKILGQVDSALVGSKSPAVRSASGGSSTNRSIERQVALKCAIEFCKADPAFDADTTLQVADQFDAWLRGVENTPAS